MRLSRIIPLTSLGIVAAVLVSGALHDDPLGMEFTAPPQNTDIAMVDLGLGDLTLRAILVDTDGEPVPDAGITTEQGGRPAWTWTGRDGSFELGDLRPGPLLLRVVALGFKASQFTVTLDSETDAPIAAERERRTLTLDRRIGPPPVPPTLALADLDGSVQLGPLATPELGYELLFQPVTAPTDPAGGFPRRTLVAPDGSFHVDMLHAGRYRAILLSPDDRGAKEPDLLQTANGEPRTFSHEIGGDTPRLSLIATMGAVTGRAFKTVPNGGEGTGEVVVSIAIRGALVKIERLTGSDPAPDSKEAVDRVTFRATRSDKDGRFEIHDLQPGRYRLQLVAGRDRRTIDVTIPTGEVVTIDADLADRQ